MAARTGYRLAVRGKRQYVSEGRCTIRVKPQLADPPRRGAIDALVPRDEDPSECRDDLDATVWVRRASEYEPGA